MALIVLAAGLLAAGVYSFLESRRIAAEEARQQRAFEREMASVELPPWNGETYDWTPEALAYLADPEAYADPSPTSPIPVVPPSTVSGPLPALETDEDFLARLKAENTAFLAELEVR